MLEWRFAAQWANYTVEAFERLDGEQQSFVVATYRVHNQIEAVLEKAAEEEARRKRKNGGR